MLEAGNNAAYVHRANYNYREMQSQETEVPKGQILSKFKNFTTTKNGIVAYTKKIVITS